MKLQYLFFVMALSVSIGMKAQLNLVPNPSFEDTLNCPSGFGQIIKAKFWQSFAYTPDLFSPCANSGAYYVGVPNNFAGFQEPFQGNNYAGFVTYANTHPFPIREYLGIELSSPLEKDSLYYMSAFISNGDSINDKCSTNGIGFRFTNTQYSGINPMLPDNFSHFHCDSIIKSKINWVLISGSFIADSNYQYLTIGNYFDNNNTDTSDCYNGNLFEAYYYIDAVCVTKDSLYNMTWTGLNSINQLNIKINIFPNPGDEVIYIDDLNFNNEIEIFDLTGRKINIPIFFENDRYRIQTINLPNSIYLLKLGSVLKTFIINRIN